MEHNLFIPKKIKVGFQKREGTFTGKLAYVIYFDEKNVLRKEKSWEGWRHKNIEPIEFDNVPMNGFLFNKGVQRTNYHWGTGRSSIRVYDSRDFEFEINVDNLMGILMHSDVSKRDIVEECIYAWDGPELVLLPTNSEQYENSLTFTNKHDSKISAKNLVKGYSYVQKKSNNIYVYLGFFEWFDWDYRNNQCHESKGKKHVFYDPHKKWFIIPGISTFSSVVSEEIHNDYSNLVEEFFKTTFSQPIVGIKFVPDDEKYNQFINVVENSVNQINFRTFGNNSQFFNTYYSGYIFIFKNKQTIRQTTGSGYFHRYSYNNKFQSYFVNEIKKMGFDPDFLTEDQFLKVLDVFDFKKGHLDFVLENRLQCKANL